MNLLRRWLNRDIVVIVDITINYHEPASKVTKRIAFSSFIVNNLKTEGIIMATQFGKAQKVPYKLAFLDVNGNPATDAVPTNIKVSSGDQTVATVDELGQFIVGVSDGACTITVTGTNSLGQTVSGQVGITISDTPPPPPPPPPAGVTTSIG